MNKQKPTAFLIILSIFVLSMKDSASLIHTILHLIPNNPWHQHADIHSGHHHINPLEIHKYLQNKHAYGHNHSHAHTHDLMDHVHTDATDHNYHSTSSEIKIDIKIDYFFQDAFTAFFRTNIFDARFTHQTPYYFSPIKYSLPSHFQPPRA